MIVEAADLVHFDLPFELMVFLTSSSATLSLCEEWFEPFVTMRFPKGKLPKPPYPPLVQPGWGAAGPELVVDIPWHRRPPETTYYGRNAKDWKAELKQGYEQGCFRKTALPWEIALARKMRDLFGKHVHVTLAVSREEAAFAAVREYVRIRAKHGDPYPGSMCE